MRFWEILKEYKAGKQGVAEGTNNITYKQQKGKNKFSVEMLVDGKPAGMFQYDANTGRTITELDPAYRGQGLGQRLILKGIYTAAMLGMDYVEDESRTAMFDRALDSLADAGYIVNDEEYWYVTDSGEQFLKQGVTESTEEIPQEIYNLLDELTADDTGSEDFGNYVLRFEGFTDWCQQDAAERCELPDNDPRKLKYYEDVYDEVLQGWIREQGAQPVDKGFAGDEDYPVQWAVFKKQGVAENFADGKVKGKSRPGRVKRAGASCAGSVTDLRAKAKKYSGEKGKMYHWCANMKGGKK